MAQNHKSVSCRARHHLEWDLTTSFQFKFWNLNSVKKKNNNTYKLSKNMPQCAVLKEFSIMIFQIFNQKSKVCKDKILA